MNLLQSSQCNELVLPYLTKDLELSHGIKNLIENTECAKDDRKISARDYISSSREILLAKIAVNDKKCETERLKEHIDQQESKLILNKELYEQDQLMINKYVEYMCSKAKEMHEKVIYKTKQRRIKENELDKLLKQKAMLSKTLVEKKNICSSYKSDVDFMNSIVPIIKQKKKRKFFVTEEGVQKEEEVQIKDKEYKEIKDELGLSENDSDTEIPVGFSSVDEFLQLMNNQASKAMGLMKNLQDSETYFYELKRENEKLINKKTDQLKSIKDEIIKSNNEMQLKLMRINELKQKIENIELDYSLSNTSREEKINLLKIEKELKIKIKEDIMNIYRIFNHEKFEYNSVMKALKFITNKLMKLKMVRDHCYMIIPKQRLIERELEETNNIKKRLSIELDQKRKELSIKRINKLKESLKVLRFRKYGRETMRMKYAERDIKKNEKTLFVKEDDEFDDKYFVD